MKILEKIGETWPRWWKAAKPVMEYAGYGFLDAMNCIIFFSGGALIALGWRCHRGWSFWFLVAVLIFLFLVTVAKEATGRWMANRNLLVIKAMTRTLEIDLQQMLRMRKVVRAAYALRSGVARGETRNLATLMAPFNEALEEFLDGEPGDELN